MYRNFHYYTNHYNKQWLFPSLLSKINLKCNKIRLHITFLQYNKKIVSKLILKSLGGEELGRPFASRYRSVDISFTGQESWAGPVYGHLLSHGTYPQTWWWTTGKYFFNNLTFQIITWFFIKLRKPRIIKWQQQWIMNTTTIRKRNRGRLLKWN